MKLDNIVIAVSISSVMIVLAYLLFYYKTDAYVINNPVDIKHEENINITRLHKVPIILYHNIDGKGTYSIELKKLKNQFDLLKKHLIKVISLQTLESHINGHNPFNQKVVSITFDDGYRSMYTKLMPLADSLNYPFTLFVYTDNIYYKSKNNLTWEMVKELHDHNIDIQCHSQSHPDLVKLYNKRTMQSKYELYREIYLSKKILELYLQKPIYYFAFPYGRYTIELTELCRDAGYKRVFSTDYGPNIVIHDNFCLRRHHIKSNYRNEKVLTIAW
ncbi:MAG TPA: polysaccharide deacetylase family protein [Spirochaetota bacterium]|nr:polysaccharide deacetylase family protein [Spirochaetota bacterium]HPD05054.1 polysaccharide deacetylase family protein [Spirochaetota bacterium]HQI38499.1 polysaccharide deacetylase family protein [Spirochaetota bacterium]HQK07460.1 polysaccharide deacetylase family protein [Spirochaetota bacterium]HRR60923.1 polysaccharide deacetylase family protein [Spirochaetota bacterium]